MAGHSRVPQRNINRGLDRIGLTTRERIFIEAVATGTPPIAAVRAAGYAPGTAATVIMRRPQVQQAIALQRERAASVRERAETAHVAREATLTAMTVASWREAVAAAIDAAIHDNDLGNRLRGLELAGKHLGVFEAQGDQTGAERAGELLTALGALVIATRQPPDRVATGADAVRRALSP